MTRKKRDLTDDEKSLWNRVAQKVKPLPKEKKRSAPAPSSPYRPLRKKPGFSLPLETSDPLTNLSRASQVSHRIERVRKVEVEAKLDLHGLSRDNARLALTRFLISRQEQHCLWVLVITGKGRQSKDLEETYRARPYKSLQELVPQWLEEPHLRSVVSAYTTAKPHDGGSGAYYVRLKRYDFDGCKL